MKKNLIYIHGIFDNRFSNPNLYNICKDLDINFYSLSLPGHGDEAFGDVGLNVESYTDFVRDYIIKNKINKNLIVYGHSMGGGIATCLVSKYGKELNVVKLILEDPLNSSIHDYLKYGLRKPLTFFDKIDKMDKKYTKYKTGYIKRWFKWFNSTIKIKNRPKLLLLAANIISRDQFLRLDNYYKNIKIDTYIFFGEYDRFIPPEISILKLNSLNSNFKYIIIKNSGHAPHTENPNEFRNKIISIL